MRFNAKLKKIIVASTLMMITSSTIFSNHSTFVYAADSTNTMKFEKISNPDSGEREIDGLEVGGDRENSYSWAMTARGEYVYVGTNKNVLGTVATSFADVMVSAGATEEQAWAIIDMATNGDIPKPTATTGGEIFKCNIVTGEITKIYTADEGVAFRMAMEFEGNLYFASYSSDLTANNYIYKIDENDNITEVFVSTGGASMRAACIYDDELYFGGVDARTVFAQGDEECAGLAIIKKDATDDTKWDRVADYKDFKEYASDAAVKNSVASPIWDICSYDGYIYATIPNSLGTVMYKGHPANNDEVANEYGWYWSEVIGKNSEVNNIGLADTAEGQIGDNAGLITASATPFVFNNKLYLMNFDNTISAVIQGISGRLLTMTGQDVDLSEYLKPMYTTLKNPQRLWCYDDITGKFNDVEGFNELMVDTCNEYLWRTEVYNGELYITTMDSAVIYDLVAKFTGANFTTMTEEELDAAVISIDDLIAQGETLGSTNTQITEMIELLKQIKIMVTEFKTVLSDGEAFNEWLIKYEALIGEVEILAQTITSGEVNPLIADLADLCAKVDWDGLRMYAYIVRLLENNNWGFDLIKTADGEKFEIFTDSGFGDKYNYGGRSLVTTEKGLYLGTANPFYGTQLWRISEGAGDNPIEPEDPTEPEEPTEPENPTEPEEPTEPEDPTEPENPTEPEEPTEPEDPTEPDNNTGISKEEYENLKETIEGLIKNQEKFEEEIDRLNESVKELKDIVNERTAGSKNNSLDSTTANGTIPKAGNTKVIAVLTMMIVTGIVVAIKYNKYRDIY